jgi:hypothetical protein
MAQSERGNITGVATDPSGAAIAGADITITQRDTNATSKIATTPTGEYTAPNLLPGVYRIEITAAGFKRFVQQNLNVSAGSTVRVDAVLQIGQVSEAIEVTTAAATIQTENAKVSTLVENKLVDELPLVVGGAMRSPFNLVAVAAEARGSGQSLALGGGQVAQWDATLDGHSVGTNRSGDTAEAALNTPSVESLTEFTVDTNGFKAEYGQAGGGVMTFASKSGTNQIHGSGVRLPSQRCNGRAQLLRCQALGVPPERLRLHVSGRSTSPNFTMAATSRSSSCRTRLPQSRGLERHDLDRSRLRRCTSGDFSKWVSGANNQLVQILRPQYDASEPERNRVDPRPLPQQPNSCLTVLDYGQTDRRFRAGG